MKKAITITVAGTLFTIEDDAYQKLDEYIKTVQKYFGSNPEGVEIIKDIEARIAEQLMENKTSAGVITINAIDKLISIMGKVEDFDDAKNAQASNQTNNNSEEEYVVQKRLYRDTDDVIIAGVASGIAHYFGLDPVLVRVGWLILSIITSGAGIIAYIICAIIIPKAETPAEKIQQKGGPVKLSSFKKTVDENIERVKKNSKASGILKVFGKLVRICIRIIVAIIGAALLAGGIMIIIGSTFVFANLVFNIHSPYVEFPVAQVLGGPIYFVFVVLAYILFLIPAVVICSVGIAVARLKRTMNVQAGLGLGALWVIAVLVLGVLSVRFVPVITERIDALPQYQIVSKTEDLKDFTKLELHGINNVKVVQSKDFGISEEGRQIDIDRTAFSVQNGTLVLSQNSPGKMCFFCSGRNRVNVTISMPDVSEIEASGLTSVTSDGIAGNTIDFALSGNTSLTVKNLNVKDISIDQSGVTAVSLSGTADTLTLSQSGVSHFDGRELKSRITSLSLSGASKAIVYASEKITGDLSGVSSVKYSGTKNFTVNVSGSASVTEL